jgi:hypothetical protein
MKGNNLEKITIRESSVGSFALELQSKLKEGFVISEVASEYPWLDNQYNAVLVRELVAEEKPKTNRKPPKE